MSKEEDIIEVVDEIVDDMDPLRIEREAERLGLSEMDLVARCMAELRARMTGMPE